MPTIKIKNLNTESGVNTQLRLYKTEGSEIDISNAGGCVYEFLDSIDFCFSPLLEISCDGALGFAVLSTDTTSGSVIVNENTLTFETQSELVSAVNGQWEGAVQMHQLDYWDPTNYPRAGVSFLDEWDIRAAQNPNIINVTLSKFGSSTEYISGDVDYVIDQCATHGILINFDYTTFRIGTKPGTQRTLVVVDALQMFFDVDSIEQDLSNDFANPTMEVTTTRLKATVGWDDLDEFWCFHYNYFTGMDGTIGDSIKSHITNKLDDGFDLPELTDNNDYSVQCSGAANVLSCKIANQYSNYVDATEDLLNEIGLKYSIFNQSRVVESIGTNNSIVTPAGYRDIAVKARTILGYAIPVPIKPM